MFGPPEVLGLGSNGETSDNSSQARSGGFSLRWPPAGGSISRLIIQVQRHLFRYSRWIVLVVRKNGNKVTRVPGLVSERFQ